MSLSSSARRRMSQRGFGSIKGLNQSFTFGRITSRPPEKGLNQSFTPILSNNVTPVRSAPPAPISQRSNSRSRGRNTRGSGSGSRVAASSPRVSAATPYQAEIEELTSSFQPTSPGPSLEEQARKLLELEFGPKRSALQRAIEAARKQFAIEESSQKGFGDIHDKRLQEIYNALTGQLKEGQGARQQIYDTSSKAVGEHLDQARGSVEGASKTAQTSLEELAKRLGLEAGVGAPTAKLAEDASALSGLISTEKGNRLAGLASEKANQLNFGQAGIDMSGKEQASERTELSQGVLRALQELGIDRSEAENEYQGELADLSAQEGPMLQKIISELQQQEKQNEMDEFARMIQQETLNIQRGRLGLSAQGQEQDFALGSARLGLDQARLGLEAQKMQLEQERSATQDPLKQTKLEAEIRNIESQIAARSSTGGGTTKYGKAQVGLDSYVKDKVRAGSIKNPNRFRSVMAGLIANVDKMVANNFNDTGKPMDPYTEAVRWINANGKRAKISTNLLKQAAAIYYGKA